MEIAVRYAYMRVTSKKAKRQIFLRNSKELMYGYYACVSYIDFLVGVTDELKKLKLMIIPSSYFGVTMAFTPVIMVSGQKTHFEQSARAPLIIVDPRQSIQD